MSSVACVPMGLPDPRATPRSPLSLVRQVALCARSVARQVAVALVKRLRSACRFVRGAKGLGGGRREAGERRDDEQ